MQEFVLDAKSRRELASRDRRGDWRFAFVENENVRPARMQVLGDIYQFPRAFPADDVGPVSDRPACWKSDVTTL
jgi:hypothetical protein